MRQHGWEKVAEGRMRGLAPLKIVAAYYGR